MRQLLLSFLGVLLWAATHSCQADLLITLQEVGDDRVLMTWEGSGTINAASTIGTINNLDFVDFLGAAPFGPGITPDGTGNGHDFTLAVTPTPITMTINPDSASPISTSYQTIRLDNEGFSSDFSLVGVGPLLQNGQTYEASGSALVAIEQGGSAENLKFSDLNIGTYSTNSAFDAGVFGGVTLQIVPVPEGSAAIAGLLLCGLALWKRAHG